jgi:hypothetical protein
MNRQPIDHPAVEVTNTVWVIADRTDHKEALAQLQRALAEAGLPPRQIQAHAFGASEIEIEATFWRRRSIARNSTASSPSSQKRSTIHQGVLEAPERRIETGAAPHAANRTAPALQPRACSRDAHAGNVFT